MKLISTTVPQEFFGYVCEFSALISSRRFTNLLVLNIVDRHVRLLRSDLWSLRRCFSFLCVTAMTHPHGLIVVAKRRLILFFYYRSEYHLNAKTSMVLFLKTSYNYHGAGKESPSLKT